MSSIKLSPAVTLTAFIGGSLFTAGLLLRHFSRRFTQETVHPSARFAPVAGLQKEVEIVRDHWGVPHIYARSNPDLFFAQGYIHAHDRLFQMDTGRRLGWGRLGEILGPAALPTDRMARILGWPRAAKAQMSISAQDPQTQNIVAAYTAGINAFIACGDWPLPYRILRIRPEPWQPADCVAWGTVLAWGLSSNWDSELIWSTLLAELGPEKAADLMPSYRHHDPSIIPPSTATPVTGPVSQAIHRAFQEAAAQAPGGPLPGGPGAGSNNWSVRGEWTETGRPLLANDPHLPPLFPAIWYENHLHGGDYHVTGFTTPGVPGVVIGHNEHIAWGVTNGFPDIQDLYTVQFHPHHPDQYAYAGEWRRAEVVQEEIRLRGRRKPYTETVRFTHHGPVITGLLDGASGGEQDLALRWTGYEGGEHFQSVLAICRAKNWSEFDAACRTWSFPSQNVVYADVTGHIGYLMPGRVPVRGRGQGLFPLSGDRPAHEWTGWIDHEELPRRFDPAEGFIVTANNRVAGDEYPHFLTANWLPPYRAQRITNLLHHFRPLSIADCRRIQLDTVSLLADRFLSAAIPHLSRQPTPENLLFSEVILRLEQWWQPAKGAGCDMRVDAVGPTLYQTWLTVFTHAVMTQALGKNLAGRLLAPDEQPELSSSPFHEIAQQQAVFWLENGAPTWIGPIHSFLAPALVQAIQQLIAHLGPDPAGWQWGRLHQIHWLPLLSRVPGLNRLWPPIVRPAGGDGFTINQAEVTPHFPLPPVRIIASCRMIVDVGEWDQSIAALPGGQSERRSSAHYQDGLADWSLGAYHPMLFSRQSVLASASERFHLRPKNESLL